MTDTPRTLEEAIKNGVEQFQDQEASGNCAGLSVEICIKIHVQDFLAQRFGALMLSSNKQFSDDLRNLFELIVKGNEK